MRYHGLKMAEINKIIKEYWINTYKGNGKVAYPRLACQYGVTHIVSGISFYYRAKFTDFPCRPIDQHKRLGLFILLISFVYRHRYN